MLTQKLFLFFLSMVPIIELRGAIPLGMAWGLPMWQTYLICVIGNILPVPILVVFARRVLFWCATWPKVGHFFQKIIDIGNRKIGKLGSYELLGLYLFVAIPLPGTGAWTGCLIATLLQMRLRPAFCAISLGVVTSGIIMWLASSGVFGFLSLFA